MLRAALLLAMLPGCSLLFDKAEVTALDAAPPADSFDAASCNDGNEATNDLEHPELGCCYQHVRDWDGAPQGECPDGPGCDPILPAEVAYCEAANVLWDTRNGHIWSRLRSDVIAEMNEICGQIPEPDLAWRAPSIDEVRSLILGCPATTFGGSCPVSDPAQLEQDQSGAPSCTPCTTNRGHYDDGGLLFYNTRGIIERVNALASDSDCSDCAEPQKWSISFLRADLRLVGADIEMPYRCIYPSGVAL